MLLSQSMRNGLLSKGFISIKADKTSNDSLKNSPCMSTAKRRVYLSLSTLRDNQDKDDFEMQHRGIMRLQRLQEQNQTKCFIATPPSSKCLRVLFTHKKEKKGHRFQLMKQGIESEVQRDVD